MIFYNKIYKNLGYNSDGHVVAVILSMFYAFIFLIWGGIGFYVNVLPWCNSYSTMLAVIIGIIVGFYLLTGISITIATLSHIDDNDELEKKLCKLCYYYTFEFIIADILYLTYRFCRLITYDWVMMLINYSERQKQKDVTKQKNCETQKCRVENLINELNDYTPEDTIY